MQNNPALTMDRANNLLFLSILPEWAADRRGPVCGPNPDVTSAPDRVGKMKRGKEGLVFH